MFIMIKLVSIFCIIVASIGSTASETPYTKNVNIFERTILHELALEEIPAESDFLHAMNVAFDALKNGTPVTPEELNKFTEGLNQYYLSTAYDHYFSLKKAAPFEKYSDPICMPNSTSSADDPENVEFYKVKVFGYPAFKKNAAIYTDIDSSPYLKGFTVHFNGTSDITIFNGYFKTNSDQFYFVYHTYDNIYHSALDKIRTLNGLIKPKQVNDSFSIGSDVFVHTYDSSLEKYPEINSTVYPKFQKVLQEVYLPKLAALADAQLKADYAKETHKFHEIYRQKVFHTLMESLDKYMRQKGQSNYTFEPVTLSQGEGLRVVHSYTASIDGFVNYEKYEMTSSKKEFDEFTGVLYMGDNITISYPQSGDKLATMAVKAEDQRGKTSINKFVIKTIKIESAFKANMTTYPVHVKRDLSKWKFTKSGFSCQIYFYDFMDFFQFIQLHISKEIGTALGSILSD